MPVYPREASYGVDMRVLKGDGSDDKNKKSFRGTGFSNLIPLSGEFCPQNINFKRSVPIGDRGVTLEALIPNHRKEKKAANFVTYLPICRTSENGRRPVFDRLTNVKFSLGFKHSKKTQMLKI